MALVHTNNGTLNTKDIETVPEIFEQITGQLNATDYELINDLWHVAHDLRYALNEITNWANKTIDIRGKS
jgi:hypothetical protein